MLVAVAVSLIVVATCGSRVVDWLTLPRSTTAYIEKHGNPAFVAMAANAASRAPGDKSLFGGPVLTLEGIYLESSVSGHEQVFVYTTDSTMLVYAKSIIARDFKSSIGNPAFFALPNRADVILVTVQGDRVVRRKQVSAVFLYLSALDKTNEVPR